MRVWVVRYDGEGMCMLCGWMLMREGLVMVYVFGMWVNANWDWLWCIEHVYGMCVVYVWYLYGCINESLFMARMVCASYI